MKYILTFVSCLYLSGLLDAQVESFMRNHQFDALKTNPLPYIFEKDTSFLVVYSYQLTVGMNQSPKYYVAEYNYDGFLVNLKNLTSGRYINILEYFDQDKFILSLVSMDGRNFITYLRDAANGTNQWIMPAEYKLVSILKIDENNGLGLIEHSELDRRLLLVRLDVNSGQFETILELDHSNVSNWNQYASSRILGIQNEKYFLSITFKDSVDSLNLLHNYLIIVNADGELLFNQKIESEFKTSISCVSDEHIIFIDFLDDYSFTKRLRFTDHLLNETYTVYFDDIFQNDKHRVKSLWYEDRLNSYFALCSIMKESDFYWTGYQFDYDILLMIDKMGSVKRVLKLKSDYNSLYNHFFNKVVLSKKGNYFLGVSKFPQVQDLSFIMKTDTCGNVVKNGIWGIDITQEDCGFVGLEDVAGTDGQKILLYPNPNNGVFRISNTESGVVEVYNLQGQKVHTQRIIQINEVIQLGQAPSGVYLLRFIENNGTVKNAKFVVE